jgi:DMSO/TMAO reductase YedYZ heme-binding membrane subunit
VNQNLNSLFLGLGQKPLCLRGFFKMTMKLIYTILFFADTLVLVFLAYTILKFIDTGTSPVHFVLTCASFILCILLLVYFLLHYIKQPSSESDKYI